MANDVPAAPKLALPCWLVLAPEFKRAIRRYSDGPFASVALAVGFQGHWELSRFYKSPFVLRPSLERRLRNLAGLVGYSGPLAVPAPEDVLDEDER